MLGILQRFGIVCGAIGQWTFILLFLFGLGSALLGTITWGEALAFTIAGVFAMIIGMAIRYILAGSTH